MFDAEVIEELLLDDEDYTVVELFPEAETVKPLITKHWGLLPRDDKPKPRVGLLNFGLRKS